jgi:hypothetical protein
MTLSALALAALCLVVATFALLQAPALLPGPPYVAVLTHH